MTHPRLTIQVEGRFAGEAQVNEAVLVEQSRTGNVDAYASLVGIHQDRIYQLTYRITGNREDAWDAAQNAFLRAHRSLKTFRGTASFSTWLHRIAVNAALDIVRRRPVPYGTGQQRHPSLEDAASAHATAGDPLDEVERRDVQQRIHKAIVSLPTDHRVVVVLRDIQGFAYDEIARILQVPIGTVRSRLSRGREALRVMLADLAPTGRA